jgi:transposase
MLAAEMCEQSTLCSVVREGVVDSDPEVISALVRSNALGLPVICINAGRAKAVLKMQINKSDRNVAAGIGRIKQTGWFNEISVKNLDSHSVRALGELGVAGQDQA